MRAGAIDAAIASAAFATALGLVGTPLPARAQVIPDHVPSSNTRPPPPPDTRREIWLPVGVYSSVTWRSGVAVGGIGGEISLANVAYDRRVGLPAYGGVLQVEWDGAVRGGLGGEVVVGCLAEGLACLGGEALVAVRARDAAYAPSLGVQGALFVEIVGILSMGFRIDAPLAGFGAGGTYPVGFGLSFTAKAPVGIVKY